MTLQECYKALGGSYEEVLRLLQSERLVQKFVLKFLEDKSYELLNKALEEHDQPTAYRAVHTLKGVCQNLAFTRLQESASALTEALRDQWGSGVLQLAERVRADYGITFSAIEQYQRGL